MTNKEQIEQSDTRVLYVNFMHIIDGLEVRAIRAEDVDATDFALVREELTKRDAITFN